MIRSIAILTLCLCPFALPGGLVAEDAQKPSDDLSSRVAALIEKLDSDEFAVRKEAEAELEAVVAKPELGESLATQFAQVLLDQNISFEVRWRLERWCKELPQVAAPPKEKPSPDELRKLVVQLGDDSYAIRTGAKHRLRWWASRDENVQTIEQVVDARLKEAEDEDLEMATVAELNGMRDFLRPGMVAEYWANRKCTNHQYLIIGVPSHTPNVPRPSHFDRIDDKTVHCVSGNNLSEGDYPLNVAVPHPTQPSSFFRLVSLRTPRLRIEYERSITTTDYNKLLTEITRETMKRAVEDKRCFSERELVTLQYMDFNEVSRLAGEYLCGVDDEPLPEQKGKPIPGAYYIAGRGSRHAAFCEKLVVKGTKEAGPGLIKAIEEGRFLPPTSKAPYRVHWLAALSLADRCPWDDADDWLASVSDRTDPLLYNKPTGPQLGATAAAILTKRHHKPYTVLGLVPARDNTVQRFRLIGCRYPDDKSQEKVRKWVEGLEKVSDANAGQKKGEQRSSSL